jgi:hypothetical protein
MSPTMESQTPPQALGTGWGDKAPAEVVARNGLERDKRRTAELHDALHFLTHDLEAHKEVCIFEDDPCTRTYDPLPYAEARPVPEHDYVGTGIGLLYGLGGEEHAWQLAGWNVRRSS